MSSAVTDLVVEDDRDRRVWGKVGHGQQVVVRQARPAVQNDERRMKAAHQFADDFVVCLERLAVADERSGAFGDACSRVGHGLQGAERRKVRV